MTLEKITYPTLQKYKRKLLVSVTNSKIYFLYQTCILNYKFFSASSLLNDIKFSIK